MATPVDALKTGLAKYYASEEHSDCTIVCGPYHFKVHKLVIGAHSEYFRAALKANTFQEGKTGTIELKAIDPNSDDPDDACDDPEIVKLMVGYFYRSDYLQDNEDVAEEPSNEVTDGPAPKNKVKTSAPARRGRSSGPVPSPTSPESLPTSPKVHLIEHAKLFTMAVKYHVDALRDLTVEKFRAEVEEYWDHEDFPHAIHVIFTTTAEDITQLREVAVDILDKHSVELFDKAEIATLLHSIAGLACDLLMRNRFNSNPISFTATRLRGKTSDNGPAPCYAPSIHTKLDTAILV